MWDERVTVYVNGVILEKMRKTSQDTSSQLKSELQIGCVRFIHCRQTQIHKGLIVLIFMEFPV